MKYSKIQPLTEHIGTIIDIWFENNKSITREGIDALKDTLRLTLISYYEGSNDNSN